MNFNSYKFEKEELTNITARIGYYNKLQESVHLTNEAVAIKNFKLVTKRKEKLQTTYFFDLYQYIRYFPKTFRFCYLFGDVICVPEQPTIVKSRPINNNNANSVLMKLNKIRHFLFVTDTIKFQDKKDMLIGRLAVFQPQRTRFWEMYFGHPLCDLGQTNKRETDHPEWTVKRMSIAKHLRYKFILCLEGNDVATNLKWVMSSNSIAVMTKPRYETWFMEGRLIANYHYVEIKPDYSDLEERLRYYLEHVDEALQIIEHAHHHVAQFRNEKMEDAISVLTFQKYFDKTRQLI